MSPAHFDKNLNVEKSAIRFTALFQIAAILLLIFLALIGDKSLRGPTILLGILSLLEIIGLFCFLILRFRFIPLVKQKNQLLHLHNDLKRQVDKTRSNLAIIKRRRQEIIDRSKSDQENRKKAYHEQDAEFDKRRRDARENEKRQLDESLKKTQQSFIDNGLRGTKLDKAQISGIGPKLKEKLAGVGITSAWDISAARIMRIPGFGEAKARSLTAWRVEVESDLNARKPKSLTNEVIDMIHRDIEMRMDQIKSEQAAAVAAYDADMQKIRKNEDNQLIQNNNAETQAADNFNDLTTREQNLRNQLNRYKDITLKNYLLQAFSSGGSGIRARLAFLAVPLVFLFSAVFSSEAAVSSAISMAIDAIPTATPTPTATLTPTATSTPIPTSTPTQTLTPTITDTPTNTFTPSITPTPTITPTPGPTLPAASGVNCVPTNTERTVATVRRVIDGDTIEVVINGKVYKVRYIGMDTPEISPQVEPGGREATTRNVQLVQGKKVTLVKDVSETDQYDRLLRYVLVGNIFVNYQLVSEGFAQVGTYPPDVACSDVFTLAQRNAVTNQVGLWASEPTIAPTRTPIPTSIPNVGGGSSGGGSVNGSGPTALCRDGTYSYSAHHQGTCSHHGGVAIWYK